MEEVKRKPNQPRGLRWPPELEEEIEKTAIEDGRDFTHQVIKLVEWGLQERKEQLSDREARKSGRIKGQGESAGEGPRSREA